MLDRICSETRATLVAAIARGRRWLDQLTIDASINTDRIAEREGCSVRKVNMTISLAFLAPDLVKAAIDGRLPYGMGIARLTDLPAEWSKQREMLGFPSHCAAFKPSLYQRQSPPSGNAILRGRDKGPETVPAIQSADCRDKMRAQIAASSGRFALNREIPVCAGLRGGAGR